MKKKSPIFKCHKRNNSDYYWVEHFGWIVREKGYDKEMEVPSIEYHQCEKIGIM